MNMLLKAHSEDNTLNEATCLHVGKTQLLLKLQMTLMYTECDASKFFFLWLGMDITVVDWLVKYHFLQHFLKLLMQKCCYDEFSYCAVNNNNLDEAAEILRLLH